jgi:hypothetical protein
MDDIGFEQKFLLLSKERQLEIIRLVEFAAEEGMAIKRQYDITDPAGAERSKVARTSA